VTTETTGHTTPMATWLPNLAGLLDRRPDLHGIGLAAIVTEVGA
jgi:hypothetical protein